MKVQCIVNNLNCIENNDAVEKLSNYIGNAEGEVGLDMGSVHTVYGVEFWDNHPLYYLCVDNDEYPIPFSSVFFKVVDERLSQYWVLRTSMGFDGDFHTALLNKEWANNTLFYERLLDGDSSAVSIFGKIKKIMDSEF